MSYFDLDVGRLALRVKPPQRPNSPWASWFFVRYTTGGRERRFKIGPGSLPLDEARRQARIKLAIVDQGGDPAGAAAEARAAWSVAEAVAAYVASAEFRKRPKRSQVEDQAKLRLHLVYRLGHEKLAAIDVPAVRRLIRAIEGDTRINARKRRLGGPGVARRTVRLLSALCTWCVGEGQLARNPIIGNLRLSGDGMREATITSAEQYRALFGAMDALVAAGKLRPAVQAMFILLASTGLRRNEAKTLRWGDVNLADRRIRLRTSKGAKLSRSGGPKIEAMSLPLFAVAALTSLRTDDPNPNDLVFQPQRGELLSVNREWRAVCAAAGLPNDLVIHSLRHSAATVGILSGLPIVEVQRMLRHRNVSTTQRYLHFAEAAEARLSDRAMERVLPRSATADAPAEGKS